MPVPGIEQIQQCHHLVDPGAARGNPTQAAVVKTLRALGLKAIAPASERALGHAQDLGCLQLAQLTPVGASVNLIELDVVARTQVVLVIGCSTSDLDT